ncbi:Chromatin assembly factor 1 subunit FAS1 [Raphanus sativus]|uniref:Chromatin assembly factor 1 subunit FAS1-like n=1 Tax=Raphanus sativus TaxID=3726 RepID=A0A9W3CPD1_RAPSA|nr:chromatin assembly factor 1 subunit FAS1-like [Raphanus sativus]KAJ4871522.1 Chromatin assembly factor 1 subunit FAS1 [Raphanus sativus]
MDVENRKTTIGAKKRKREPAAAAIENLTPEEKDAQIQSLKLEMESLFVYFRQTIGQTQTPDLFSSDSPSSSVNSMVALLMEETSLPLSKLVDEIFSKLREKIESVTMASVKTAVVSVGQRVSYGVPNAEADVLEDDDESCLWCWETRELKMMPKSVRGLLKVRRTCRKKIHERITAVSAMLGVLQRAETDKSFRSDLNKAAEKLGKILSEVDIRSFMDNMLQKNSTEMADKDAKREEKLLLKQLEKTKCEAEKEKKRMDRQLLKEKLQLEKEQKLLQKALNEDKEKEEAESRKRIKKQQDESEKEQKRREKEQAELKKQLEVQKQASIMERFLKRSKDTSSTQPKLPSVEVTAQGSSCAKPEDGSRTVIEAIDNAFATTCEASVDDIRREHFTSWRQLSHSLSRRRKHWGMRRKPKSELFPKLKLSTNNGATSDGELNMEKQEDECQEKHLNDVSCVRQSKSSSSDRKKSRRAMQLLQFDKSYRPGFYGIWPTKSQVVGPRRPLKKDPELDYEVDSDEEWEEEQAGESLSDCENDEEESLEEGCSKGDEEDDSEDDFMVPDGYLSEDEGVQVDRMDLDPSEQDATSSPSTQQDQESQEFRALVHQQKQVQSLTDHALAKTQPLIICNLTHEKVSLLAAKDLEGAQKMEQICLRALVVRAFPCSSSLIEISISDIQDEDQEAAAKSSCSQSTPPSASKAKSIPDSDLLTVVSTIQSCSQGITKVVETLQQKFPDVPKTKLRQKVREISDFEDSRWQVKKEVLTKLGLSPSPDKGVKRPKMISTFFSKRCLPPSTNPPPPAVEETARLDNENDA